MTLKENVAISDSKVEANSSKIREVLEEAGFEKDGIGLDDMRSPEYGGVDISGGQTALLSWIPARLLMWELMMN